MLKRFWAIFIARNKDFYRDKAALGWNFIFPFMIIAGFAMMFQRGAQTPYKVGLIPPPVSIEVERPPIPNGLENVSQFRMIWLKDKQLALDKLAHHRLDMVIQTGSVPLTYWIDDSSPKGKIAESLLIHHLYATSGLREIAKKFAVQGNGTDYIDWLFPGILAMNMMFSSLFGVGYVIVWYRKNGVLKRFKATPLTTFEYLSAQMASRLVLLLISNSIVYAGCSWLFGFQCRGSYLDLIILFTLGSMSMICLGLIVASRGESEEFANGILNLISWPMMFLSEVWFSLEGASHWVQVVSQCIPLTHVTEGMRRIMNEGASLGDLGTEVAILAGSAIVFMAIGSYLFQWTRE